MLKTLRSLRKEMKNPEILTNLMRKRLTRKNLTFFCERKKSAAFQNRSVFGTLRLSKTALVCAALAVKSFQEDASEICTQERKGLGSWRLLSSRIFLQTCHPNEEPIQLSMTFCACALFNYGGCCEVHHRPHKHYLINSTNI